MIGDDENPGTPAAAPEPRTPAAPEPAAPANENGASEAASTPEAADATQTGEGASTLHLSGDPQQRRRRRRRRRRPGPKLEGAAPDAAGTDEAAPATSEAAASEGEKPAAPPRRVRVEAIAAGGEFSLAALPASDRPRRRRRRRHGARPEGVAPGGEGAAAQAAEGEQQQQQQRRERGPRQRGPRRGGDRQRGEGRDQRREGQGPDGQARDGQGRDGQGRGERREGQAREGQPRDGERRDRDRGPRRGKGGKPFGKGGDRGGRGDRRDNKPAPKLYSFESVVDRGYEDVAAPPPAEGEAPAEGGTRRVDWTIVKRTLADQRAAKTVSAQYILKRDGAETEFPNLGAARAAVNKTIVHPEKLTRAKGDYPSTKK
jgi:hypothetical protein